MSFDSRNVILGRGDFNNYGTSTGMVFHTYADANDLQAAIIAPGFLADFLGATAENVKIGDVLSIRDSASVILNYRLDTVSPITLTSIDTGGDPFDQELNTTDSPTFATVTATTGVIIPPGGAGLLLPTGGETADLLNYYAEYNDQNFQFAASPWASQGVIILRADRTNEKCTVRLNGLSANATSSDFINSLSTLPTWLRPSEDSWTTLQIINNTSTEIGKAKVSTTGEIQIFSDLPSGDFTTPGLAGWSTSTITYYIQDQ